MATQDGDFVTAEGLAKTLGEVGGGDPRRLTLGR